MRVLLDEFEKRNDIGTPLVKVMRDEVIAATLAFEQEHSNPLMPQYRQGLPWCTECDAMCPSACKCGEGEKLSQVKEW